jgi:putative transposase
MSADKKAQVLETVEATPDSKRKVLAELGVSKSAYYRWRARARHGQLEDRSHLRPSWNRLSPQEESVALEVALKQTNLSSRQLAAWITDNKGFSVSESTVYRLLKSQGLIKSPEMKMAAGKEFHTKTTRPHQMWATDASYFRVSGWGFYYLVTVMDDFSRFILAWRLQTDMTSDSFIEVVQDAVDLARQMFPGSAGQDY